MAVGCPITTASTMSLDAPFAEELDRSSRAATPSSLREAPTAPGTNADVKWDFADSQPPPQADRGPEWCVDLGDEMVALHAVDLFTRLATGVLPADTPVWRCGREAWTPARDVPELRFAIEDAAGPAEDPVVDVRGEVELDDELLSALAFAQAD